MNSSNQLQAPGPVFNFAQYIIERNETRASKVAYIDDTGELTYGDLALRLRQLASGLLASGIHREERVLLIVHDCRDWPVAFLGCMYAGIVPVAVNTLLTAEDYAYMLENTRAQAVIVSGTLLPTFHDAMAQAQHEVKKVIVSNPVADSADGVGTIDDFITDQQPLAKPAGTAPDDQGFWLYSSGSTGRPKGTVHTHANPYWTAELYGSHILKVSEDDVCFSAAKLFFAYGLGNALTFPLAAGATVVLMAGRPTPEAVFERWIKYQPTVFFGSPTGYAGMLDSPALPTRQQISLRVASSAGEALPAELGRRFTERFGIEIIDGIGSTEMLHVYISNRPGDVRYGATGWPVPGYEVELRDDSGQVVPTGEPGDLYVRGPSSALMYWCNREKTRETFCGSWTKSGDKYICNSDGTYTYAGRSDDMLKVSGIYVSPFEIEATLVEHPAVLETAVIGVIDASGLTKTKAFVVLKSAQTVTEAELKAFVKEKLAPYKYPRIIEFVAELPKTATGKIQRFRLREMEKVASPEV